ncbi:AraC family transcriptional regulator [Niabella aurantiaca]|uniref:AraC family transcriptional regulator n=1 Tax=Niabella aurantiaca TaxID=379900 RepID=UPI0003A5CEE8|nr:AraC family transcriptional regulator [Niabella aurantiaca]
MRAQFHKLPLPMESSFLFMCWECDYFDKPWHFHKEYELVLIDKTEGTRFIGDQVSYFKDGDLILISPNTPHLYRNHEAYYQNKGLVARSIFIHFTEDFLGKYFFDLPEMTLVRRFLDKSSLGIEIGGDTNQYVRKKLYEMKNNSPAERLLGLLDILIYLSTSNELNFILSSGFTANKSYDTDKINTALQFIMENYTQEIYIEEIAFKLNMSIPSFSRYFKHHTRKTFSNYISEIRIAHACRLLIEDNYSISEICYLSGFDSLSNYYRHFKKQIGVIPKEYKNRFLSMDRSQINNARRVNA